MNIFDDDDSLRKSRWNENRTQSTRFNGNQSDDRNVIRSRFIFQRQRRKHYMLRRALILLLILLMFITGAFGALADNPITAMFREQIAGSLSAPYLNYLNSFLRTVSMPPIEPPQQTAQTPPASGSGIDVIGFLIDLFSSDGGGIPAAQVPQATQQVEVVANTEPPVSEPATQAGQLAQPTTLPLTVVTAVPTTVTAAPTTAPVSQFFFAPPPTRRPKREPVAPVNTTTTGVTSTTPADGAANIAVNTNIVINFNENVNVTSASFTLNCAGARTFAISGSGTATITLDPTVDLPAGTFCTVTMIAAQVTDTDGIPPNTMAADYTFTFTTQTPVDTAPSVTGTNPANSTTGIATNAAIVINFSEAVIVTGGSFTLNCAGAQTFTFVGSGTNAITLTPSAPLPIATLCTLTVVAANVSDVDAIDPPDTMTADYTLTFTTADTAPNVASSVPTGGATGVLVNSIITINFSENVNVTGASFTLSCAAFTVGGTGTNVITLIPTGSLPYNTSCTVTVVANQVSDVDTVDPPNTMTDGGFTHSFSFTTETAPPPPLSSINGPCVFTGLAVASTYGCEVSTILLNGAAVSPLPMPGGTTFTLAYDYQVWSDPSCATTNGCDMQVLAGFASGSALGSTPAATVICEYSGVPGSNPGVTMTSSLVPTMPLTFTAPAAAGTYDIFISWDTETSCATAIANYTSFAAPTYTIAQIIVP